MSLPIVLPHNDDISPLSLAATMSPSTCSDLSLDGSTVVIDPSDFDALSLSTSTSSSSCEEDCCRSLSESDDSISLPDTTSSDTCLDPTCCPPPLSTSSKSTIVSIPADSFEPLLMIGGGPHSLALAARLSEPRPAALYTDLEHARLAWLRRDHEERKKNRGGGGGGRGGKEKRKTVKGHWSARKLVAPDKVTLSSTSLEDDIELDKPKKGFRVLDATSNRWIARWRGFFKGLRIEHLRSPMLFHPAPADVDALVAYSRRIEGGEAELEPIHGVVGRELSKHQRKKRKHQRVNGAQPINERDRQDYFRPSTRLFDSFITDDVIDRYDLSSVVTHTTVTSITYGLIHVTGREPSQGFVVDVQNPDGSTSKLASNAVAIAPGPSNRPNIPRVVKDALPRPRPRFSLEEWSPWNLDEIRGEGWCHSSAFSLPDFSPLDGCLGDKIRRQESTTAVVIGGGLTSVQIISSLLDQGVDKIYLVCRSHIKIKHFDFPLEWVSKFVNFEKAGFWNSPTHQDRLATIQAARDGGSVNPSFYKLLQTFIKRGQVEVKTLSEITKAEFVEDENEGGRWMFEGKTNIKSTKGIDVIPETERWELNDIDYLVSSTGSRISLGSLDFLDSIRTSHPIEEVGGLPCLTGDLQWNEELPLFVLGAYAMLELGPDALNLSGTRTGAERVAHRLGELGIFETISSSKVSKSLKSDDTVVSGREERDRSRSVRMEEKEHRSGGRGNYFRGLAEVEV